MAINSLYNLGSQQLLNNSTNLGYIARAGARNSTTPEDRRLDYFWRDAFMTVVTAYFFELCGRTVDANYASPKMTEALKLNKLAEIYKKQIQEMARKSGGGELNTDSMLKINMTGLDKNLHHRFLTQQLKAPNFGLVPELLKQDLNDVLVKSRNELKGDEALKQIQAEVLTSHLQRNLNYQQLLENNGVPTAFAEKVMKEINEDLFDKVEEKLRSLASIEKRDNKAGTLHTIRNIFYGILDEGKYMKVVHFGDPDKEEALKKAIQEVVAEKLQGQSNVGVKEYFDKKLASYQAENGCEERLKQAKMPAKLKEAVDTLHGLPSEAEKFFTEALHARYTQNTLKKIKNSGEWPKLALMLATNIMYFGVVGNWMDFNVIQPFQKKISDERGGVKELIAPAYGAIIPGALTVWGMSKFVIPKVPMLAKMGPAMRFMVAGTTGMGAYVASSYGLVMARLANLRAKDKLNPPKPNNAQPGKQNPAQGSQGQGGPSAPSMTVSAALQSPRMPLPQPGFPPAGGPISGGFKFGPQPTMPFNAGFGQPAGFPPAFGPPRFGQQGAEQQLAAQRKLPPRQG